jgi:hypothetical protein
MRHAGLNLAFTIVQLTIAVVVFAIRRLLVFVIRFTELPLAGFVAAIFTAIAVPPITAATDIENCPTVIGTTESLAKNNVRWDVPAHPHRIAAGQAGHHHETLILLRVVDCLSGHRYESRPQPGQRLGSFTSLLKLRAATNRFTERMTIAQSFREQFPQISTACLR